MAKDYFYHNGMLLSEDELMHFKYIKREKKNGRWVYYYDDSELKGKEKASKKAAEKATGSYVDYYNAKSKFDIHRSKKLNTSMYDSNGKITADSLKKYAEMNAKEDELHKTKITNYKKYLKDLESSKKADRAYEKYKNKTAISRTVSKGVVKAANAISNLTSKIKKKKKKKTTITTKSSSSLVGVK